MWKHYFKIKHNLRGARWNQIRDKSCRVRWTRMPPEVDLMVNDDHHLNMIIKRWDYRTDSQKPVQVIRISNFAYQYSGNLYKMYLSFTLTNLPAYPYLSVSVKKTTSSQYALQYFVWIGNIPSISRTFQVFVSSYQIILDYSSYIVSVHIQCQASIYTFSLCRGHSWRVRLAKQETLTPPGHLVSHLVCRGPWMSTVVLCCWCHSDSTSVLLYFTFALGGALWNAKYQLKKM